MGLEYAGCRWGKKFALSNNKEREMPLEGSSSGKNIKNYDKGEGERNQKKKTQRSQAKERKGKRSLKELLGVLNSTMGKRKNSRRTSQERPAHKPGKVLAGGVEKGKRGDRRCRIYRRSGQEVAGASEEPWEKNAIQT